MANSCFWSVHGSREDHGCKRLVPSGLPMVDLVQNWAPRGRSIGAVCSEMAFEPKKATCCMKCRKSSVSHCGMRRWYHGQCDECPRCRLTAIGLVDPPFEVILERARQSGGRPLLATMGDPFDGRCCVRISRNAIRVCQKRRTHP